MKIAFTVVSIFFISNIIAHERDTTVCKKSYFILSRYQNGKAKELGETKDSIKNGAWIYLDENGKITQTGHYKNNKKEGWWGNGTSRFIIYKKDKAIAVGKGCWCCPDF
jgi:hypothetical protein